ncbi:hypothetical protein [Paenibacillus sp. PL91]|uniref:hypothetical protein n=1 Tax=Paenibacillus sp. PL91 TaxID=2729538 RepID=UPI00145EA31A|nr:hypothetical protein [Paenibacillus sp. PL91]MBC9199767.1 hypothetical protein [Paenibacillus sp. PL91]
MKFEKLQEFREQDAKHLAKVQDILTQKDAAQAEVRELKAQYEMKLRQSVEKGIDAGAELDALSDRIDAAEKVYRRKEREYTVSSTLKVGNVTPEELSRSWREEFMPAFKKAKVDPAAKSLLAAKLAYIDAFMAYRGAINELKAEQTAAIWALHPTDGRGKYAYSFPDCDFHRAEDSNKYYIKDDDLRFLAREQAPLSIQYVKRGEK